MQTINHSITGLRCSLIAMRRVTPSSFTVIRSTPYRSFSSSPSLSSASAASSAPLSPPLSTWSPSTRAPRPAACRSTYRSLRRAIFQSFYSASQYSSYDELARDEQAIAGVTPGAKYRKEAFALDKNKNHVAFAHKRGKRWLGKLADTYRTNAILLSSSSPSSSSSSHPSSPLSSSSSSSSPTSLSLQSSALDLLALLHSNMEHSRFLLEGGWGLRRNNLNTLKNVAHKVGLQMPKKTMTETEVEHVPAGVKHQKARDAKLDMHDKFTK